MSLHSKGKNQRKIWKQKEELRKRSDCSDIPAKTNRFVSTATKVSTCACFLQQKIYWSAVTFQPNTNFPTSALTVSRFGKTSLREVTVPQKKKHQSTWSSLWVISYWDTKLKCPSAVQEEHYKHSAPLRLNVSSHTWHHHSSPHLC